MRLYWSCRSSNLPPFEDYMSVGGVDGDWAVRVQFQLVAVLGAVPGLKSLNHQTQLAGRAVRSGVNRLHFESFRSHPTSIREHR